MATRDPEVDALTAEMARLTRQASHLSTEIHQTVEELEEFQRDVVEFRDVLTQHNNERRRQSVPWPADKERRRE